MLIPPPQSNGNGNLESELQQQPHVDTNTVDYISGHETIQSLFSATKCYDLIGASNKVKYNYL